MSVIINYERGVEINIFTNALNKSRNIQEVSEIKSSGLDYLLGTLNVCPKLLWHSM